MVGWGAQISFAKIVKKVTGKTINKSETYTDWCRRPLRQSQIDYALDDVRYLVPVYHKLVKQLDKLNRYGLGAGGTSGIGQSCQLRVAGSAKGVPESQKLSYAQAEEPGGVERIGGVAGRAGHATELSGQIDHPG